MEIASVLFKTTDLLLKFLGSPLSKEIQSIYTYEEDIKMIAHTVNLVRNLLSDIESKQSQDESVLNGYIRLREAFLDAEDFLDKVETHKKKLDADDRKLKTIRRFFTSSNQAKYAIKVHNGIKENRKNFNSIAEDLQKFGPKERNITESTARRACETYSFVDTGTITGRDEDKRIIIDLLLGFSVDEKKIRIVSIVGIGGMGKTTLAQLVFNDESLIERGLFDLRLWVSDSQKFNMKSLLVKILLCISPDDTSLHNLGQEQLQNRLTREIRGKKYILVLDDVQNEIRKNWLDLEGLLNSGAKESVILVTTRSRKVAKIMGTASTYELQGLSENHSWELFTRMAFEGSKDENLIEMGKLIVKKCCRVPLAIKTIGCLLFGEDRWKWERVRDSDLGKIEKESNDLMPILKISYDDLDPTLKQCFRFCALFPKNVVISKEILSSIWMANGCIKVNEGQSAEDVCDNNIKILYNRCFLEEVERDKIGNVTHFRMHDLMHDLAKEVAGVEMLVVDSSVILNSTNSLILKENVRHMNLKCTIETADRISRIEPQNRRLRTLLHHDVYTWRNPWEKLLSVDKLISEYQVLRMLDLQKKRIEILSNSISKLIHLRYLNLSYNEFDTLPESIVELWNLESLLLKSCTNLKKLPMGIRKLINLKHLDLEGCYALTHMPSRMGELTALCALNTFIIGPPESKHAARLEDLEPLSRLRGDLVIKLPAKSTLKEPGVSGALLLNKRLRTLKIEWPQFRSGENLEDDMDIFVRLQPHSDLEVFTLYGYEGLMFPHWLPTVGGLASVLPNLVSITIDSSVRCQHLPSFSQLVCLNRLTICDLSSLEYIEESVESELFFPSLEYLWLMGLPELKGWCKRLATVANEEEQCSLLQPFSRLLNLHVYGCPCLKMASMPLSSIKEFSLKSVEKDIFTLKAREKAFSGSGKSLSCEFHTNDARLLLSIPWEQYLQNYLKGNSVSLVMKGFIGFDIQSTDMTEAFRRMSNQLVSLTFLGNSRLNTLSEGMKHLTALQHLRIERCENVMFETSWCPTIETLCQGNEFPWKGFKSLKSLNLIDLPNMVRLPRGIEFLTSLQVLGCIRCRNLKEWPMGISKLINLKHLIFDCCDHMPSGIGALTSICGLRKFIVSDTNCKNAAKLEELEPLVNLQGDLEIKLLRKSLFKRTADSVSLLLNKKEFRLLKWYKYSIYTSLLAENGFENDMEILAELQTHTSLKVFSVYGYEGKRFPSRVPENDLAAVLPNLEYIVLENSKKFQHLPILSRLPLLRHLSIRGLPSLEYIEENASLTALFFPCLERLSLVELPKLKGWYKGIGGADINLIDQPSILPSFRSSCQLYICECPNLELKSLLPLSSIQKIFLLDHPGEATFTLDDTYNEPSVEPGFEFHTEDVHLQTY